MEKANSSEPEFIQLLLSATVVTRHIIRTLIFYAIPGDGQKFVNKECLESARAALSTHNAISNKHKNDDVWSTYLHLYATPLFPLCAIH